MTARGTIISDIAKNTRGSLAANNLFGFSSAGRRAVARRAVKEMGLDVPIDEAALIEALNEEAAEGGGVSAERSETA